MRYGASGWLLTYFTALALACIGLNRWLSVNREVTAPRAIVLSEWQQGVRVGRRIVTSKQAAASQLPSSRSDVHVVSEDVLDEGPVLGTDPIAFAASFVPSRDGVKATYRGTSAYLTPDDLLNLHAYDFETDFLGIPSTLGVKTDIVLSAIASELRTTTAQLLASGRFRRVAMRPSAQPKPRQPDISTLESAVTAAAHYLARQVKSDGTFRYEIDATTGAEIPGYSWPRHAGATWFLARVANYREDGALWQATRRAIHRLTNFASLRCGQHRCIGEGDRVDLGSSALALLALCEAYHASLEPSWEPIIRELADFIRSQQHADGEFAHIYDRETSAVVDEQLPYYTGEAVLALSRAHLITHDARDLEAASRALNYLVSRPLLFVTWPYFWKAEHWTCQAVTDLWTRAPNPDGLQFCLAWQRYNRGATSRDPEYTGAAGRYLFRSVPLTSTASTTEAAVATLALSRVTPIAGSDVAALEQGIRHSLALLLRTQFTPGPDHLMKQPAMMHGGVPASTTDLTVRIDYVQHAASAWMSYLRYLKNEPWDI